MTVAAAGNARMICDNLVFTAGAPAQSTVPEPGTLALLGTGMLAVGGVAVRRKRTTV